MKVPEEYFKLSEWMASVSKHSPIPQQWETVAGFIAAQQREIERLEDELQELRLQYITAFGQHEQKGYE